MRSRLIKRANPLILWVVSPASRRGRPTSPPSPALPSANRAFRTESDARGWRRPDSAPPAQPRPPSARLGRRGGAGPGAGLTVSTGRHDRRLGGRRPWSVGQFYCCFASISAIRVAAAASSKLTWQPGQHVTELDGRQFWEKCRPRLAESGNAALRNSLNAARDRSLNRRSAPSYLTPESAIH